ncbi:MAG: hypothetical protein AB1721_02315 [Patescibacteria group bacterium]
MTKPSPKMRLRKNTQEWRVLKFLDELTFLTLDTVFLKGYSRARLGRLLFGLDKPRSEMNESDYEKYKRIFSATLTRLKLKGYVSKEGRTKMAVWKVSQAGEALLRRAADDLPQEDGVLRLFIFDIPENLKQYRDWIRFELVSSGYRLLQKSVWLGERPLSKGFLQELVDKDLFQFIHFFEIKDEGTLKNLEKAG